MKNKPNTNQRTLTIYLEPIGDQANEEIARALHSTGQFVETNQFIKKDASGTTHPVWECSYQLALTLVKSDSLKGKIKVWIASGKRIITDGQFIFKKTRKTGKAKSAI